MSHSFFRSFGIPVLFGVAYAIGAELGHLLSFEGVFASFWPPSGIYLSTLLLARRGRWPVFLCAALVANLISDIGFHGKAFVVSLGFWTANSIEATSAALLIQSVIGTKVSITSLKTVLWLLIATAFCGNALGATIGATVVTAAFNTNFLSTWLVWWISGSIGSLLFVPAILNFVICKPWRDPAPLRRAIEGLLIVAATALASQVVFGSQERPLAFATLPPLLWAAVRLNVCGTVLSATTLAVTSVWHTIHGHGPFALETSVTGQVLLTQSFLVVGTLASLMLASLTMERQSYLVAIENHRRRLEVLASTDALTGVSNRGAFQIRVKDELESVGRHSSPLSLVLIDVDHFKSFNDTFGHSAGDDVLREVGLLLRQSVRTGDFVARYGGEEFAVLLPNTDEHQALPLAERIRACIESAIWKQRAVTISVGVTTVRAKLSDSVALINAADGALYESKRRGRNRVSFNDHKTLA